MRFCSFRFLSVDVIPTVLLSVRVMGVLCVLGYVHMFCGFLGVVFLYLNIVYPILGTVRQYLEM